MKTGLNLVVTKDNYTVYVELSTNLINSVKCADSIVRDGKLYITLASLINNAIDLDAIDTVIAYESNDTMHILLNSFKCRKSTLDAIVSCLPEEFGDNYEIIADTAPINDYIERKSLNIVFSCPIKECITILDK